MFVNVHLITSKSGTPYTTVLFEMNVLFVEIYFIGYLKFNYIYNLVTQMNKVLQFYSTIGHHFVSARSS